MSHKSDRFVGLAAWIALCVGCAVDSHGQTAPAGQNSDAPAPVVAAAQVQAAPPLWKITSAHGTLYLLGTIHMMKPNVNWESLPVKSALAASSKLVEEVSNADDQTAAQALLLQYGIDREHPLSTKIAKDDLVKLDTALKQLGYPGESALEPLRPWAVMLTLSVLPMMKAGYTLDSGVDVTLAREWKVSGKTVDGLETAEQQIHFFADMSDADQVKALHISLDDLDHATKDINEMVAAWIKGDVETIGDLENKEFKQEDPSLYKLLIVQRNKTWVEQLSKMLDSGGTEFVAVGAGHLPGDDGVLKLLEVKGFTVTRE